VTEEANRAPDLRQALPSELLRSEERRFGILRVAVQRHARAREVQHRDRQRMGDDVVDLARDALPFVGSRPAASCACARNSSMSRSCLAAPPWPRRR
jgi:hypothetical protein